MRFCAQESIVCLRQRCGVREDVVWDDPYEQGENCTMKASVTKIVATVVFGAGLLFGSTAWAGQVYHPEVLIFANSSGQGSMYGTRSSADTTQYIGCTLNGGPSGASVGCSARNSAGTYIGCYSANPYHREAVTAMTAYSWLYFTINATTGECRNLIVRNDSVYLP
jgi:hypothetical protein